jgi:hypothetical protein
VKKKATGSNLPEYRNELAPEFKLDRELKQCYRGVETQIYPLPAQIIALQTLCDKLLNSLGDEDDPLPVYFKPAAPWVLAQVCNYGEIDVDPLLKRQSWFSQHEVAVGFPVEWYKVKDGQQRFHNWAMFYPFIFVDNPYSMSGGRQVYGWSKAGVEIERRLPEFAPDLPRCLVSATRRKYDRNHHGPHAANQDGSLIFIQSDPDDPGNMQEFFEVTQQRPFLSGRAGLINAVGAVPSVVGNFLSAASGVLDLMGRTISAFQENSFMSLLPFLKRWYGFMAGFIPTSLGVLYGSGGEPADPPSASGPEINIITRKQFRDAEGGGNACYQAIVGSCMKIDRALDGGLLFDPISPDTSGGVRIKVFGNNDFDLVAELGLSPAKHTQNDDQTCYELRPVAPFWTRLDLSYGAANYQCWRAPHLHWSEDEDAKPGRRLVKYGAGDSGSRETLQPPLTYNPLSARFFLLKARTNKLERLVDRYLENDFFKFKLRPDITQPELSIVWAIAISFHMTTGSGQPYDDRALVFMLPMWMSDDDWQTRDIAMFPIYSFVGTDWSFLTYNEVFGIFTARATLASPPNLWIDGSLTGDDTPRLLEVKTQVLKIRRPEPQAAERTIFTVRTRRSDELGDWVQPSPIDSMHLMQMDDYMHDSNPFYTVILKQIHDAKEGDRACYRSLVRLQRKITIGTSEPPEVMPAISIEVGKREGHALVRNLGLVTQWRHGVETLEPELCVRLPSGSTMIDESAKNLCWQAGSGEWQRGI